MISNSILTNQPMNMMPTTTPTEAETCDLMPPDDDATAVAALCVAITVFAVGVGVGAWLF
jgi:hypothetical protein